MELFHFYSQIVKNSSYLWTFISPHLKELERCSFYVWKLLFCCIQRNQLHRWERRGKGKNVSLLPHVRDLTGLRMVLIRQIIMADRAVSYKLLCIYDYVWSKLYKDHIWPHISSRYTRFIYITSCSDLLPSNTHFLYIIKYNFPY